MAHRFRLSMAKRRFSRRASSENFASGTEPSNVRTRKPESVSITTPAPLGRPSAEIGGARPMAERSIAFERDTP
eukprot:scaffold297485_cov27-Tisochrysis_lutea.AAC.5